MEALTAQLEALSRSDPVLMIFEDAHWLDPTGLEVLGRTVDRLRTLRVLLIITYRPEFEPPWIGRPNVTALSLNRLGEREIGATLRYLPKYSPDLNPIEMPFSKLKADLRKTAARTIPRLRRRIGKFAQTLSARETSNYFRHAGYA
jgi:hypothetical protein